MFTLIFVNKETVDSLMLITKSRDNFKDEENNDHLHKLFLNGIMEHQEGRVFVLFLILVNLS